MPKSKSTNLRYRTSEISTILLAKGLGTDPVVFDDYRARKVAKGASESLVASACLKPSACGAI